MVKEIARYGGAQVQLASNLIHHRASSKGSVPRGAQVHLASNLVHHPDKRIVDLIGVGAFPEFG
jgi:hypothetical protein